jgi:hypothetical protein
MRSIGLAGLGFSFDARASPHATSAEIRVVSAPLERPAQPRARRIEPRQDRRESTSSFSRVALAL